MELVYARSSKQPGGLLKHRDKRLLIAIIVSSNRQAPASARSSGRARRDTLLRSGRARAREQDASRTRPPSSRRCGVVWVRRATRPHRRARKQRQESLYWRRRHKPPTRSSRGTSHLAKRGWNNARKVEWIQTAHAPPYGYGKNHGYTRIVRLALPLLSSVAASSQGNAAESLAQHVRWHCRVSHVAAHTAQLTVRSSRDLLDVVERRLTTERLLSFVDIKVAPDLLDEGERTFAPVLRALREADASIDAPGRVALAPRRRSDK